MRAYEMQPSEFQIKPRNATPKRFSIFALQSPENAFRIHEQWAFNIFSIPAPPPTAIHLSSSEMERNEIREIIFRNANNAPLRRQQTCTQPVHGNTLKISAAETKLQDARGEHTIDAKTFNEKCRRIKYDSAMPCRSEWLRVWCVCERYLHQASAYDITHEDEAAKWEYLFIGRFGMKSAALLSVVSRILCLWIHKFVEWRWCGTLLFYENNGKKLFKNKFWPRRHFDDGATSNDTEKRKKYYFENRNERKEMNIARL